MAVWAWREPRWFTRSSEQEPMHAHALQRVSQVPSDGHQPICTSPRRPLGMAPAEPAFSIASARALRSPGPRLQPSALDQRIAAALTKERQVTGRLGAHALTVAFVAVAIWCALVHPWPAALYYLGIVAAFVGLAWAWGRRARRPVPSWLVLAFVLANAVLLTVTLLVPNPFDPTLTPVQMSAAPAAFLVLSAAGRVGDLQPCRRGS